MSLSFEKGRDSFEVRCDDREGERQVKGGIAASGPLRQIAEFDRLPFGVSVGSIFRAWLPSGLFSDDTASLIGRVGGIVTQVTLGATLGCASILLSGG